MPSGAVSWRSSKAVSRAGGGRRYYTFSSAASSSGTADASDVGVVSVAATTVAADVATAAVGVVMEEYMDMMFCRLSVNCEGKKSGKKRCGGRRGSIGLAGRGKGQGQGLSVRLTLDSPFCFQ